MDWKQLHTAWLGHGDCREGLKWIPAESIHSCVTDPPYNLNFMGKSWDKGGIANNVEMWRLVYNALRPGGYLLAFGGTRTYHRMTCAIEDAGFEIRDCIQWLYGSGFPKSLDVSKAIDKAAGAERTKIRVDAAGLKNPPNLVGGVNNGSDRPWRLEAMERGYHEKDSDEPATDAAQQWQGWGTALKPANEPIVVARKPLIGTVAENVLEYGTGALNIDGCRVETNGEIVPINKLEQWSGFGQLERPRYEATQNTNGRWPANVIHDGSEEVLEAFAEYGELSSGSNCVRRREGYFGAGDSKNGGLGKAGDVQTTYGDSGTAARFFYCAKANKKERTHNGFVYNDHPTVKPLSLIRYLCRLVTAPGGTVLDPFMGSGTTALAAMEEGYYFWGIEKNTFDLAVDRVNCYLIDSNIETEV